MSDELKVLTSFATPTEADIVRNRLQSEGIQAFLADDQTVGSLWYLGNALNGVKILVAESDLPAAIRVLEDVGEIRESERAAGPWNCPKCAVEVDGGMDVCWACGTTADGQEDPEFQGADALPAAPSAAGPDRLEAKGPPRPLLALLFACVIPLGLLNFLAETQLFVIWSFGLSSALLWLFVVACDVVLVVAVFQWLYYQRPSEPAPDVSGPPSGTLADCSEPTEEGWPSDALALRLAARRAYVAAVLGIAVCPPSLNLYSLWLIVRHRLYGKEARRKQGQLVYSAMLINALVLGAILLFWVVSGFPGDSLFDTEPVHLEVPLLE